MGSAVLEASLPAVNVILDGHLPVHREVSRAARGYKKSSQTEVYGRHNKFHPQGKAAAVLIAEEPESVASPAEEAAAPPTPGEMLLGEFDAIYEKYHRRVYRQCFRMVRNQEDAEDLTQEVFLLLYRKAHTFRGESNFSTWLHRLTVNTVLMKLRSHRRWRETVTSLDVVPGPEHDATENPTLASSIPAPPESTVDKIGLDIALEQLSEGYREIFLLHDAEGYRHDEIAKLLGISEGTSKSQLHKARFRLRKLVESGKIRNFTPHGADGDESTDCCAKAEDRRALPAAHRSRISRHKVRVAARVHAHGAAAA